MSTLQNAVSELETRFVDRLPGDPITENAVRQVSNACYSRVTPTPVAAPRLLAHASEVAELLNIVDPAAWTDVWAGNRVLENSVPYAQCYGGHQFGSWAGQLGDGRAISLGELQGQDGQFYDLQLKGAGPTPYSRHADGRAVLRSSIREFLCSEAMHHLGVPTTRALSLVATGDEVVRDMFYDGHPEPEPGAIVCRVAPSFLRFGSYEIHAWRKQDDVLRTLVDYTIENHFPELGAPSPEVYLEWVREVCRRTAHLVTEWMRVGFVHGVMNTDNMSIHGLTIDYGPYGWVDNFDPSWTPNTTDAGSRRYAFGRQPRIAHWNLVRFASSLVPLFDTPDPLNEALDVFGEELNERQSQMIAAKLGLGELRDEADHELVNDLFELLPQEEIDMTLFFRGLADLEDPSIASIETAFYRSERKERVERGWEGWLRRYLGRRDGEPHDSETRRTRMNKTNPRFVLRNYLAQNAIEAATNGDLSVLERLQDVLRAPYEEQPESADLAEKRPEWARHKAGCSALSCSS
ncbi:MAG: YdiU family protein [Myxococcota bacterium]